MRKYTYNLDVLDDWSPGLASILGLALTDGTVNIDLTRITFYSSDVQMLEVVKNFFESTRLITPHSRPGISFFNKKQGKPFTGKKQMYAFLHDSKQAAARFYELDVMPNNSYAGPYPIVPQKVWWHFFRSVLEGDGNITFSRKGGLRIKIAGNRNCLLGLQSDLAGLFSICSTARYLGRDRVKLLDFSGVPAERAVICMYQASDNLRLERKYQQ